MPRLDSYFYMVGKHRLLGDSHINKKIPFLKTLILLGLLSV